MKNLKNTLAAITMMTILALGTTFANAGIVVAFTEDGEKTRTTQKEPRSNPCGEPDSEFGIVVAFGVGIVVAYTGIILTDVKVQSTVNCGIVVA